MRTAVVFQAWFGNRGTQGLEVIRLSYRRTSFGGWQRGRIGPRLRRVRPAERKAANNMTAEDLKRRLRNSFESSLLQRIATAR